MTFVQTAIAPIVIWIVTVEKRLSTLNAIRESLGRLERSNEKILDCMIGANSGKTSNKDGSKVR